MGTPAVLTFPEASRSCTAGCTGNGTPLCAAADGWVTIASPVGPAALTAIVLDTAEVSPGAVKSIVTLPLPVSDRFAKVAVPAALVVAVVLPPSVALPEPTAAETTTPAWPTALPQASRSCSTGWGTSGCPLVAEAGGGVVQLSWLAAAATSLDVALAAS